MLKCEEDYDSYFEDTMKAGHYENDKKSVEIMIRSSADVVKRSLSIVEQDLQERLTEVLHTQEKELIHLTG